VVALTCQEARAFCRVWAAAPSGLRFSTIQRFVPPGGALRLTSIGLGDDVLVRVRAVKVFGGTKPTQTILLKAGAAIFVRPDSTLGVTAKPSIVDHGAKSAIQVDKAAKGVTYALHAKAIADLEFSRLDPPDPAGQCRGRKLADSGHR